MLCQRFGKENLPITVCDGIFNLSINKSTCAFCQIFLLDKRCSMQFCMVCQIKCNVHLLYSFILVFIPSQSVFGKSFAKPLAKAFRKTSIILIRFVLPCRKRNADIHNERQLSEQSIVGTIIKQLPVQVLLFSHTHILFCEKQPRRE